MRPRTITVSEAVQLVLLAEPIWRGWTYGYYSFLFSITFAVIAASIVLLATRFRKDWARVLLLVLALGGFGMAIWSGDLLAWGNPDRMIAASTSIPNLFAVGLLFTGSAERWMSAQQV